MEQIQELVAQAQQRTGKTFCEALKEIDDKHIKKPLLRKLEKLRKECGRMAKWVAK